MPRGLHTSTTDDGDVIQITVVVLFIFRICDKGDQAAEWVSICCTNMSLLTEGCSENFVKLIGRTEIEDMTD
jgi:hypothetical protein